MLSVLVFTLIHGHEDTIMVIGSDDSHGMSMNECRIEERIPLQLIFNWTCRKQEKKFFVGFIEKRGGDDG